MTTHAAAIGVRMAKGLHFAAAPTFAVMAVLTAVFGGDVAASICGGMGSASALNGMAAMYGLMSAFHLAPWLKLIPA